MHNNGMRLSTRFSSSIPVFLSREHGCPLCCRCFDIARTVFCYSRTSRTSERPSMRAIPLPTLAFGLLYAKMSCIQPHLSCCSQGANAPANLDSYAKHSFSLPCSVIELTTFSKQSTTVLFLIVFFFTRQKEYNYTQGQ